MNKVIVCILSINFFAQNISASHFEGEKENHPLGKKQQQRINWTLFDAVKAHDLPKVRAALKAHAEVDARNGNEDTPLMRAVRQGSESYPIIKELLAHKADIHLKDAEGNTVLHIVAQDGDTKLVPKLFSAGARINEKNNEGKTALMRAVEFGHRDTIKELIKLGADVTMQNELDSNKKSVDYADGDPDILQAIQDGIEARKHYNAEVKQQVTECLLKDITNIVSAYTL